MILGDRNGIRREPRFIRHTRGARRLRRETDSNLYAESSVDRRVGPTVSWADKRPFFGNIGKSGANLG